MLKPETLKEETMTTRTPPFAGINLSSTRISISAFQHFRVSAFSP
jgi:hypothetical protein